jgi:hypothetical protein
MNYQAPDYLIPFVLGGSVATIAAVLAVLDRALHRAGWPDRDRRQAVASGAVLLLAWFSAALLLSWLGFYRGASDRLPTVPYGLLIPIVAGVLLFRLWPMLKRIVAAVPQEWLVGVQVYRALGLIFLLLYMGGRMPGVFALPAGGGDVIVDRRHSAGLVRAWNLFGILDLIVAVTTGFLSSPSPLQRFAFDSPNQLIGVFPLALIPTYLVPLSVLLHFASLHKLRRSEERQFPASGHVGSASGLTGTPPAL